VTSKTDSKPAATGPVAIRAHRATVKELGGGTTKRSFDIRGPGSSVVLDLFLVVAVDRFRSTVIRQLRERGAQPF